MSRLANHAEDHFKKLSVMVDQTFQEREEIKRRVDKAHENR